MRSSEAAEAALAWKERGNAYYGKKEFAKALNAYQSGIDELEEKDSSLAIALRSNLARSLLKLEQFDQAYEECTQILKVDPQNTKGMYVFYFILLGVYPLQEELLTYLL